MRLDLRIALAYAFFGGLWILFSDSLLDAFVHDHDLFARLQTYKGWAFVVLGAILLFLLLRHELTVRKATEEKLEESEESQRQLFDHSMDAILITAPDGSVYAANPAACQLFGRTEAEIQRLGRNRLVDISDPRLKSAIEERARTGFFHGELTFLRADGTRFEGEVSTNIYENTKGEQRTSMIIRDVTKRKQAEEQLRESNAKLKKVLEVETVGVMFWDLTSGCMIDANDTFLNVMGYSRREVEARELTWQKLTPPEYMDASRAELRKFQVSGRVGPYEKEYLRKDGTRQWFIFAGSSLGDNACVEFCVDISSRKQAEEAFRLSQERFSIAFHTSPAGMTITRIADGKFIEANESFCRMFEFDRDEVIGHTSTDLNMWTPEERQRLIKAQVETGGLQDFELQARSKSGRAVFFLFSSKQMELEGEPCLITTMIDITERKRAQEELQRGERVLRLFVEHSPAAIAMFDREMRYIVASNRYLIDYDLGEQDVVGRSHYEIFSEIPERWKEIHKRCLAGATERNEEDPFPRASGKLDWIRWEIRPWHEADGEIGGVILFSEVITERKRTTEQVRYQAKLLANVNDALIASDENFALTAWNKAAERIYGWTAEEVIGKTGAEILQTKFLAISRAEAIKQLIESGEYFAEVLNPRKDGVEIYIETRTTALRDPNGKTVGYVSINRDITERKRAEQTLQQRADELAALYLSAQKLQKILTAYELSQEIIELLEKTLSYGYGAVLLLEESNGRLIPFAVTGFQKDEDFIKQGKTFITSHTPRVGQGITGWVAEHGQTVRVGDVRKDERYYNLRDVGIRSEMCVPLFAGEKVIGVLNVETDRPDAYSKDDQRVLETVAAQISVAIQNARLLEETRLSRDRLAELSKKLVEAHETEARAIGRELHDQVGQMLTALKLTLEIAPQLPAEAAAKKYVQAQELLDDLMSRVSALSLELRPPMLDDLGLVPALLWLVNRFHEQTQIVVDFKHSGVEGRRFISEIETTAYRVTQEALTNVARHARAGRARLVVRVRGEEMEIQISDDGAGFDVEAALAKNRGLGGIRERVQLVGGAFRVESQTGKGARIMIRLPLKESA
ncbi:MAG: PAS domain S-box protein [Chloroflexi bacterium]|nr:PAS domain S-box protein [Chloroflexota bacterium]